ncbi:hypothetical protein ACFX12_043267 [Malus domestica]
MSSSTPSSPATTFIRRDLSVMNEALGFGKKKSHLDQGGGGGNGRGGGFVNNGGWDSWDDNGFRSSNDMRRE